MWDLQVNTVIGCGTYEQGLLGVAYQYTRKEENCIIVQQDSKWQVLVHTTMSSQDILNKSVNTWYQYLKISTFFYK